LGRQEARRSHARTQGDAVNSARKILYSAGGSEVRIHRRDGRIRASDTVRPETTPGPQVSQHSPTADGLGLAVRRVGRPERAASSPRTTGSARDQGMARHQGASGT
jgi:hypothetical protein